MKTRSTDTGNQAADLEKSEIDAPRRVHLKGLVGTVIVSATALVMSGSSAMACEASDCSGTPVVK